jgi:hypothetical protein
MAGKARVPRLFAKIFRFGKSNFDVFLKFIMHTTFSGRAFDKFASKCSYAASRI